MKSQRWRNNRTYVSADQLRLFTCVIEILECLETGFLELYRKALPEKYKTLLINEADTLLCNAMNIPNNKINQQIKFDFFCELQRFYALLNLLSLRINYKDSVDFDEDTILNQMWNEYSDEILGKRRFTEERSERIQLLLKNYQIVIVKNVPTGIINDEVALNKPESSYWHDLQKTKLRVFKCSLNQHLYRVAVDEEISCPVCKNMTESERNGPRKGGNQARPRPMHESRNNTETRRSTPRFNIPTGRNEPGLARPYRGGYRGRGRRPRRF